VIRRERAELVLVSDVADAYSTLADMRRRGVFGGRAAMALHGLHQGYFADLRSIAAGVDSVICSNRLTAALATRLSGMAAERVHYAQYGAPESAEPARAVGTRSQLRIGWIGRLEESQKCCLALPAVAAALVERGLAFEILVAGDGPDRKRLEEGFQELGLRGRVSMVGEVPPSEVERSIYSQIDLLLITSRWETGPIVAFEAMARGVPIVATRFVGSASEGALVDGKTCLSYDIGNEQGAAKAIATLSAPEVRHAIVRGGLDLVKGEYSLAASTAAWERALLKSLELEPRNDQAIPGTTIPAGRLDRWLGTRSGERLRRIAAVVGSKRQVMVEWPFTGSPTADPTEMWRLAGEMERASAGAFAAKLARGLSDLVG